MNELITILKYLLLGVFQGVTEPIPVSSSGHLVILQHFLGIEIPGLSFELLVNFASLIAVILIYRNDLWHLGTGALKYVVKKDKQNYGDFKFVLFLVLATIPAGVAGVLFGDFISDNLKSIQTIGVTLIITGIALWLIRNLRGRKNDGELTIKDAVIIGLAQALALIPGISRSGATIVAAMGLGLKQQTALKFSFLLYIPVSVGGMVFAINDFLQNPDLIKMAIPYTVAFLSCILASYYALKWFMGIMARGNLGYFSIYCFIVGTLILIFN